MSNPLLVGLAGNEVSKKISGTSEVSVGRSVVATGSGVAIGSVASGALVVAGVVSAPVTIPLAVAGGAIAFVASLFD
ncbi:MAG: hypothetical protein COA61_009720 [Zetaproteobacteria bacterium]|nr:hypothetical protein [Zetaproteobacteria bacterium]